VLHTKNFFWFGCGGGGGGKGKDNVPPAPKKKNNKTGGKIKKKEKGRIQHPPNKQKNPLTQRKKKTKVFATQKGKLRKTTRDGDRGRAGSKGGGHAAQKGNKQPQANSKEP